MTRTHALTMLLQHGALTWRDLLEITGWTSSLLGRSLQRVIGRDVRIDDNMEGQHRRVYRLATQAERAAAPQRLHSGPRRWSPARRAAHQRRRLA